MIPPFSLPDMISLNYAIIYPDQSVEVDCAIVRSCDFLRSLPFIHTRKTQGSERTQGAVKVYRANNISVRDEEAAVQLKSWVPDTLLERHRRFSDIFQDSLPDYETHCALICKIDAPSETVSLSKLNRNQWNAVSTNLGLDNVIRPRIICYPQGAQLATPISMEWDSSVESSQTNKKRYAACMMKWFPGCNVKMELNVEIPQIVKGCIDAVVSVSRDTSIGIIPQIDPVTIALFLEMKKTPISGIQTIDSYGGFPLNAFYQTAGSLVALSIEQGRPLIGVLTDGCDRWVFIKYDNNRSLMYSDSEVESPDETTWKNLDFINTNSLVQPLSRSTAIWYLNQHLEGPWKNWMLQGFQVLPNSHYPLLSGSYYPLSSGSYTRLDSIREHDELQPEEENVLSSSMLHGSRFKGPDIANLDDVMEVVEDYELKAHKKQQDRVRLMEVLKCFDQKSRLQ